MHSILLSVLLICAAIAQGSRILIDSGNELTQMTFDGAVKIEQTGFQRKLLQRRGNPFLAKAATVAIGLTQGKCLKEDAVNGYTVIDECKGYVSDVVHGDVSECPCTYEELQLEMNDAQSTNNPQSTNGIQVTYITG